MLDLIDEFAAITPLSDDIKFHLIRLLIDERYERGDYLLKEGQICRHLYFIRKGIVYGYFNYRGSRRTTQFIQSGELCFAGESFLKQIPSKENIRAVCRCVIYTLSSDAVKEMCRRLPTFHAILNSYLFNAYLEAVNCLTVFRSLDALHRYQWLKEHHPNILDFVPMATSASYVGMSDRNLARFFKKGGSRPKFFPR